MMKEEFLTGYGVIIILFFSAGSNNRGNGKGENLCKSVLFLQSIFLGM